MSRGSQEYWMHLLFLEVATVHASEKDLTLGHRLLF